MTGFPKPKREERIDAKTLKKAWKRTFGQRDKFNIKRVDGPDGSQYRSGLEREYHQELRIREKVGEIGDIRREPQVYFEINGVRICGYKPDFTYFDFKLGIQIWDECKGAATDRIEGWHLRQNLWRALGPGPLRVILGDKNGWHLARTIHPKRNQ